MISVHILSFKHFPPAARFKRGCDASFLFCGRFKETHFHSPPVQEYLLTLSVIKQGVPGLRRVVFSVCFKRDITSVKVAVWLILKFTVNWESKVWRLYFRLRTRSIHFKLQDKFRSCTSVTLYTGEEFRNTLCCDANGSNGCFYTLLFTVVSRSKSLNKSPWSCLRFWRHLQV